MKNPKSKNDIPDQPMRNPKIHVIHCFTKSYFQQWLCETLDSHAQNFYLGILSKLKLRTALGKCVNLCAGATSRIFFEDNGIIFTNLPERFITDFIKCSATNYPHTVFALSKPNGGTDVFLVGIKLNNTSQTHKDVLKALLKYEKAQNI